MPIDISLLRPECEGGNIPLVELWQKTRNLSDKTKLFPKSTSSTTKSKGALSQSTRSSWTPLSDDPYGTLDSSSFDSLSESKESSYVVPNDSSENHVSGLEEDKKEDDSKTSTVDYSSLALLNYIIDLEAKRRAATNELNACRHRLKSLQRQRRPSRTPSNPKTKNWNNSDQMSLIRSEIHRLKNKIIPDNEKILEDLKDNLENHLLPMVRNQVDDFRFASCRLPNSADERVDLSKGFDFSANSLDSNSQDVRREIEIVDPLYCIEGYEKLCPYEAPSLKDNNQMDVSNLSILTGPGSILEQVLHSHALSFINKSKSSFESYINKREVQGSDDEYNSDSFSEVEKDCQFQLRHLPDSSLLKMGFSMAHGIMGCTNRFKVCSESSSETSSDLLNPIMHKQDPKLCHICHRQAEYEKSKSFQIVESNLIPEIPLPTYASFSMFHQSQNYSENGLPLKFVACTPVDKTPAQVPNFENCTSKSQSKSKSSPEFCHPIKQLNLFALCASDIYTSRKMQHDFVDLILDFYESLICVPSGEMKTLSPFRQAKDLDDQIWERSNPISWRPLLRAYSISSNTHEEINLEPNEASRIVIEGFLPSINDYIQLGHVSNFTDFASRWFKIRFGGGNQVKLGSSILNNNGSYTTGRVGVTHCRSNEYVHTVYGSFGKIDQSIRWMLENNMVQIYDKKFPKKKLLSEEPDDMKVDGIALPTNLITPYTHLWGEEYLEKWEFGVNYDRMPVGFVIPYKRRKFKSKNGKVITRAVANASLSFSHLRYGARIDIKTFDTSKNGKTSNVNIHAQSSTTNVTIDAEESPKISLIDNATKEDIVAESICNPYIFLRFYN